MKGKHYYLIILFYLSVFTLLGQEKLILSRSPLPHPLTEYCLNILNEAYSRLGIELDYKKLPLQRSVVMANNGTVDGELFRGKFEQSSYPNLLKVPVALAVGEISVFTKGLDFDVVGWESLEPYSIAIRIGLKPAEKGTEGMNVLKVHDEIQLFKMLNTGRVEVVIAPKDIGVKHISDLGITGITVLAPPIERDLLFHYLNRKHEVLIPQLTTVLKEMQSEGYFEVFE